MHDLRVSDGKREPSWQDLRAVYPPATICRAFWIHGTHILPKPAHFGYMARISCHEPAFFLSEVPLGMHQSTILPSPDTGERISRASCRRRTAENASRTCAHTRMHRWMRLRWRSRGRRRGAGPRRRSRGRWGARQRWMSRGDGGVGAAGPWGLRNRGWGGVGAPSVERGNRRPQACVAGGRCGGAAGGCGRLLRRCMRLRRMSRRGCARPRDGAAGGGGDTSCGGNCATRVRMNPFTPTFFRCGTVIKIICYATNK